MSTIIYLLSTSSGMHFDNLKAALYRPIGVGAVVVVLVVVVEGEREAVAGFPLEDDVCASASLARPLR